MVRYYRTPAIVVAGLLFALNGCSTTPERTVITVPVSTIPKPPDELLAPFARQGITFVPPSDPRASSALTPEGELALRKMIGQMLDRLEAWRAWSSSPSSE